MGETTHISWCDHTFNPWIGCMKVSPACDGCYAEALMGDAGRYKRAAWGGPGKGVGTRVRTAPASWNQPKRWDRAAETAGARRFVFCASLADVFDSDVPPEWRRDLFDLIHATPHLTWLLLTKRPGNIVKLFDLAYRPDGEAQSIGERAGNWPRNAAIGCTVVTQEEADREVPKLLAAKAALKPAFSFLSMEPLLGPVDLSPWLAPDELCEGCDSPGCGRTDIPRDQQCPKLRAIYDHPEGPLDDEGVPSWIARVPRTVDWVITGGETDQGSHKARPSHPDWFRALRDQCAAAGVAYHHKQNGEWAPGEHCPDLKARDCATLFDGTWDFDRVPAGPSDDHIDDEPDVYRVGKSAAGRMLDGEVHDARPEIAL